jgi:hypothetical protein
MLLHYILKLFLLQIIWRKVKYVNVDRVLSVVIIVEKGSVKG